MKSLKLPFSSSLLRSDNITKDPRRGFFVHSMVIFIQTVPSHRVYAAPAIGPATRF
jgi:hypothetical protein